jgi:predicted DNA-binding protein
VCELVQARTQRMPAELWAALDAEAHRTGVSTAELVRQAVELQLAFLAAVRLANEGGDVAAVLGEILRRLGE